MIVKADEFRSDLASLSAQFLVRVVHQGHAPAQEEIPFDVRLDLRDWREILRERCASGEDLYIAHTLARYEAWLERHDLSRRCTGL
jgi:hypothetical protein